MLAALALTPSPPVAATISLDTDGGSPPFVRGRVQGASFWFLLDTASPSSFGRRQSQRLGLPDGPALSGLAIELPGITVTMRSLAVADLDARQMDGKQYALSILRENAIRKLQLQCPRQL
jgi:hypothetical protein